MSTLHWEPGTENLEDHGDAELGTGTLFGIGMALMLETFGVCLSLGHALHQVLLLIPAEGTLTLAAIGHAVTGGLVLARRQIIARVMGPTDTDA